MDGAREGSADGEELNRKKDENNERYHGLVSKCSMFDLKAERMNGDQRNFVMTGERDRAGQISRTWSEPKSLKSLFV